jgi:uncharacterized protein DUF5989
MTQTDRSTFEKAASETRDVGFLAELWGFLNATKKWWLLPIVLVIVLFSLLIFLSGTGVAPIIYTLF